MSKKNIESTFKKKSENYQADVRPKLWDKLEKRMDDHYATTTSVKMVSIAWMRYAAALVLLLGAGFALSLVQDNNSPVAAHEFNLEELSSSAEEVQNYKDMVNFSQQHYRTLINPGAKKNQSL